MLNWMLVSFVVIALAAYTVQRTSHEAKQPRKWMRNGLLGIATMCTAVMALLIGQRNSNAFAILAVWLPAMVAGILFERWQHGRSRPD